MFFCFIYPLENYPAWPVLCVRLPATLKRSFSQRTKRDIRHVSQQINAGNTYQ